MCIRLAISPCELHLFSQLVGYNVFFETESIAVTFFVAQCVTVIECGYKHQYYSHSPLDRYSCSSQPLENKTVTGIVWKIDARSTPQLCANAWY